jgi:AraC-like DNA-binding protein
MAPAQITDSLDVTLSTAALPARDRMAIWREHYGRKVIRAELEPAPDVEFTAEVTLRTLPGVSIVTAAQSGTTDVRQASHVAGEADDIGIGVNIAGRHIYAQGGREIDVPVGQAAAVRYGAPSSLTRPGPSRLLGLKLSHSALAALIPRTERIAPRLLDGNAESFRLLIAYVTTTLRSGPITDPGLQRVVASHICDLASLVLNDRRDDVANRGVRAARTEEILTEIRAGYSRPAFSAARTAQSLRISPRYLHELLQETGESFTDRVIELRLQRALALLTDPRNRTRKINDIAFASGFSDGSYFNRRFRRRFGMSPSMARGKPTA